MMPNANEGLFCRKKSKYLQAVALETATSSQSYKTSMIVIYECRVVNISNLRVITTDQS